MAKKLAADEPPTQLPQPLLYEATLGANGAVVRGQLITQTQAEARRQAGRLRDESLRESPTCGDDREERQRHCQTVPAA